MTNRVDQADTVATSDEYYFNFFYKNDLPQTVLDLWNVGGDQGSARGRGNMRGQLEAAAEAPEGRPLSGEAAVGANGPPSKGAKSNN